jgi:hypothetical protein
MENSGCIWRASKRCFKKRSVSDKPLNHSPMRNLTCSRLRGGVRQEFTRLQVAIVKEFSYFQEDRSLTHDELDLLKQLKPPTVSGPYTY